MKGIDLDTVRELLGHKSMAMTLRYAHLAPHHKARAVNVLDSLMSEFLPETQTDKKVVSIGR